MSVAANLSIQHIALATGAVFLGSALQSVTGLGAGLIIAPLLALLSTAFLPGPLVFASLALSLSMWWAGRKHIDWRCTHHMLFGVGTGTAVAALFLSRLPTQYMGLIFGSVILAAVLVSVRLPKFEFTRRGSYLAGLVSGAAGTSSGIGAPFLALMYQHHDASSLRPTLAFLYSVSSVLILFGLHFAGRFHWPEVTLGCYLIPGFVLGFLVSPWLVKKIDKQKSRFIVLCISTLSACLLIADSIG